MEPSTGTSGDELLGPTAEDDDDEIDFDGLSEDLATFQSDDMVQQALQRGVDLKRYGAELEKELKAAEAESVAQYVENSPQVVDLHKQMQECDAVLARTQDTLLGFQSDLGGISEEIKHLQVGGLASIYTHDLSN